MIWPTLAFPAVPLWLYAHAGWASDVLAWRGSSALWNGESLSVAAANEHGVRLLGPFAGSTGEAEGRV